MVQIKRRASANHRGHLDIIADILDASLIAVKKTYLMYRCNLSFRQLKQYSGYLMRRGLLTMVHPGGQSSHNMYEVTDKGREFLRCYTDLMSLMD